MIVEAAPVLPIDPAASAPAAAAAGSRAARRPVSPFVRTVTSPIVPFALQLLLALGLLRFLV